MTERNDIDIQANDTPEEDIRIELAQATTAEEDQNGEKTAEGEAEAEESQAQAQSAIPVEKIDGIDTTKIKATLTAVEGTPIELPEGTQLARIDVFGNDLVLVEADGSLILIVGGALNPPTILLGTIEIPAAVLSASLGSGSGIVPAAGPDAAPGSDSSGQNFEVPPGVVGDALIANPLLPPTAFDRAFTTQEEFVPLLDDSIPATISVEQIGVVSDEEVSESGEDRDTAPIQVEAGTEAVVDVRFGSDLSGITVEGADPSAEFIWTLVPGEGNHVLEGSVEGNGVVIRIIISLEDPVAPNTTGEATAEIIQLEGFPHPFGENGESFAEIRGIPIEGEDAGGNVVDSATIGVNVLDSVPVAVDDTDEIGDGEFGPVSGNLITDAETNGDNGADDIGADDGTTGVDPQVVSIGSDNVGGATAVANAPVTITGEFGDLTVNPDGSYEYNRNPGTPGGVQEVFTYILQDGDGDTDTATLTVEIGDDEPEIEIPQPNPDEPDASDAGTVVFESGIPERGGEPAGSGESADGDGTNNDDPSEATAGVITFNALDGLGNVSIAGVVVNPGGLPQTVSDDATGTLVVTDFDFDPVTGNGSISYEFTLNDNTLADPDSISFPVVVTDLDDDEAGGDLDILIVDDAPSAVNDVDTIAGGEFGPATGNVITDAEGDGGADTVGADDAVVSSIAATTAGGSTTAVGGSTTVSGQYGELEIAGDGSYSYTRDPNTPGEVSDVFTYVLTDGDGDTTTAKLTIDIGDAPPEIEIPEPNPQEPGAGDDGTVVFESGLPERGTEPAGSGESADGDSTDNDDPSEATAGEITFNSLDGVDNVTIGGVLVNPGGVPQTISDDATGTLVVTEYAFDPVSGDGSINYEYTLKDNTLVDPDGVSFPVVVTDLDGDTTGGDVDILIIDDAPSAVNDADTIASGEFGPATGNVITDAEGDGGADTVGADDALVSSMTATTAGGSATAVAGTVIVSGQYGELEIAEDGSYSYTRDADTPGGVQDVFSYVLTDGDGDTAAATLTIDIGDAPPEISDLTPEAEGGDVTVDEDDLVPDGSDGADSTTQPGTFTIASPDGIASLTIGGVAIITNEVFTAASIASPLGNTLNILSYNAATGEISYTFELNDNEVHAPAGGENSLFENFDVVLTDRDNDVANGTLTAQIVDDVPEANDDGPIDAGEDTTETVNVLPNDPPGADGPVTIQSINHISGDGTASFEPGGSITFDPDENFEGDAVIEYTIVDQDGDTSTATLTINFPADSVPTATAGDALVDEDGLSGANDDGDPLRPGETDSTSSSATDTDTIVVDFKSASDVPGDLLGAFEFLDVAALDLELQALDGNPVTFSVSVDGLTLTGENSVSDPVITIQITSAIPTGATEVTYTYEVTLIEPVKHLDDDTEDTITLDDVTYEITDADNSTFEGTFDVAIVDDIPLLTVTGNDGTAALALAVELDETLGADRANPANAEVADGNTDDVGAFLAQVSTNVAGGLTTLFTVSPGGFGADGMGAADSGALSFGGLTPGSLVGVPTTLSATDGGLISLFLTVGGVIEGRDATGDTVFSIEVVGAPGAEQLQTTLFEAIDHGDDGPAANDMFDENLPLLLADAGTIELVYEVTREDGDGDTIVVSDGVDIITDGTSVFSFDDDGPLLMVTGNDGTAALALAVELDETLGADRANPANAEVADGNTDDVGAFLAQVSTNVAGGLTTLFTVSPGGFGADGMGAADSGALSFGGLTPGSLVGVPTTLSATDGGLISLFLTVGGVIEGRDATGDTVFSIEVVGAPGAEQLQTTLFEAIDHGDDGPAANDMFDENLPLLLADAGTIELVYEVTREDGDGDTIVVSDGVDIITDGTSVFSFDDDGPLLMVTGNDGTAALALAVELDETLGADRANPANAEVADGNTDDVGAFLAQVSTNVAGGLTTLFTVSPGGFGADGMGAADSGALSFGGLTPGSLVGVPTTLSATDGGLISLFLTVGGVIEGRDATGDTVFSIEVVGAPGAEQLQTTLFEAIDHGDDGPAANDMFDENLPLLLADAGTIELVYEVTREDGDGDTIVVSDGVDIITDGTSVFSFDDDGPSADLSEAVTVFVDEKALDNFDEGDVNPADGIEGSKGTGGGGTTVTSFTLGGAPSLVNFGTDGAGTFGFVTQATAAALILALGAAGYSSQGSALTSATVVGNTVTAISADGREIFTLELTNAVDGTYEFTLLDQLDHVAPVSAGDTLTLDLSGLIEITDGDGDATALNAGSVSVAITDDEPLDFSPTTSVVVNSGDAVGSSALDYFENVGADEPGNIAFTNGTDGQALVDGNGDPVMSDGFAVTVSGYGTDTLTGTANGATVFIVTLNPDGSVETNDFYSIQFFATLDDGSGVVFDDFSSAPAGQKQWIGLDGDGGDINADENDSQDLLVTPTNPGGTINTDSDDIGNANQMIDEDEGIRLDMVVDVRRDLPQDEDNAGGYLFDGHYTVTEFTFKLIQVQGSSSQSGAIHVRALNDPDTGNIKDLTGSIVSIDPASVVVVDSFGVVQTDFTVTDLGDGTIVVEGVQEGESVTFTTLGGKTFNAVEMINADGDDDPTAADDFDGNPFALGGFGFNTEQTGDDIPLTFDVQLTDEDGDTSTGQIDIVVTPNDGTVSGTSGDETLVGGSGSDTMFGDDGNDVFVLNDASAIDDISDYVIGEDVVDLSELFTADIDGGDVLSEYVQLSGVGNTELQVDVDGGGDSFVTVATIDGSLNVDIIFNDDGTDTSGTVM